MFFSCNLLLLPNWALEFFSLLLYWYPRRMCNIDVTFRVVSQSFFILYTFGGCDYGQNILWDIPKELININREEKNISFNYHILKSTLPILWYLIILICLLLISLFNMHATLDYWYFSDFIIIYLCILCPYIMVVVKLEHLHCGTRLVFKKLNHNWIL